MYQSYVVGRSLPWRSLLCERSTLTYEAYQAEATGIDAY